MAWKANDAPDETVTTTRVALSSFITRNGLVKSVTLQADDGNAGTIHVGGSSVSTSRGAKLAAGQSYTTPATDKGIDLDALYVVGSENGTLHVIFFEDEPFIT